MAYEEIVNRKLIEAAQELTRELDAEMRHDMIGARIYYEDREAGERWLRMEFQKHKPESITPGESVLIENRCKNPAEVGAGLIFREDGLYIVSVCNGKIRVYEVSGNSPKEADA